MMQDIFVNLYDKETGLIWTDYLLRKFSELLKDIRFMSKVKNLELKDQFSLLKFFQIKKYNSG